MQVKRTHRRRDRRSDVNERDIIDIVTDRRQAVGGASLDDATASQLHAFFIGRLVAIDRRSWHQVVNVGHFVESRKFQLFLSECLDGLVDFHQRFFATGRSDKNLFEKDFVVFGVSLRQRASRKRYSQAAS